ncbi:TolC family protein [Myxococcota bacterium]|nr:TolC family protein [Myxococcota bacterium]MBU1432479.1 TolC family protein [Myxococcota bacterium]MBU1900733.1 TolC family protein [Myxococcota bacterium]
MTHSLLLIFTLLNPATITLSGLLERVKEGNPAMAEAQATLANYTALFDQAYFAWTPKVKVDALLAPLPERRLLKQCVLGRDALTGLESVGPCPGQDIEDNEVITTDTEIGLLVRLNAKVTFPIYTFGKIDSAKRAARAGVHIGRATVDATRAELGAMVKQAYYGVQLAESVLGVIQDGRKRMNEIRAQIEKELDKESGRFTSNDLRKLLVEQAEVEAGYLETEALRQQALEGIRVAAGLPAGAPFDLDSATLEAVFVEPRPVEAYLELAIDAHPKLRALDAAVRARRAQVDMARAEFYPNIALVGGFGVAEGTTAEDNPDPFAKDDYNYLQWGAVLGAEWSLDFATRMSKLKQAEADFVKQRAQRDLFVQKLRIDVATRVAKMNRYQGEINVREVAMKAAKGWLVSNSLNFGLGLVQTSEILASLAAYSKTRLKYYQVLYEYNLAVAQLSKTVGVELAVPSHSD